MGAAGLFFDLYTKKIFFDAVTVEGSAFSFFNGLIRSTLHQNQGISFNIPIPLWLTILITGIALGWSVALLIERARTGTLPASILLGLFMGGVLGNVYDRIMLGFVRDWILLFGMSAINIADILIAGSLLAWILYAQQKPTSK
jgi:signal peptidase II